MINDADLRESQCCTRRSVCACGETPFSPIVTRGVVIICSPRNSCAVLSVNTIPPKECLVPGDTPAILAAVMAQSDSQLTYQGAKYSFVDCEKQFLEELWCPTCLDLVFDPAQSTCGHVFCAECIEATETCPVDHMNCTALDHIDSRLMRSFNVKCPNSARGCSWQGDLGNAEAHTSDVCDYQLVKCTNGCEVEMERRQLVPHEANECLLREYSCPLCSHLGTYGTVTTSHLVVCKSLCLPCVAGCKQSMSRAELNDHLASFCPEELVACPFKMAGCTSLMKRKALKDHVSDKDHHFAKLMESHVAAMQQLYGIMQNGIHPGAYTIPLVFQPWLHNIPTCYPRPPWVIKLEEFQVKKKNDEEWFSDPVYSHFGGYKLCLKVFANGNQDGKGTHVSVYVYLMRGDNDDNLKWPFKGTIKVSLLNQLRNGHHRTLEPWLPDNDITERACGRVTEGERAEGGRGYHKFIAHKDLSYHHRRRCQYLKNGSLFFRVVCFEPKLD